METLSDDALKIVNQILARADWLKYEYTHGGSWEALSPKEAEARYIASQITNGRFLKEDVGFYPGR